MLRKKKKNKTIKLETTEEVEEIKEEILDKIEDEIINNEDNLQEILANIKQLFEEHKQNKRLALIVKSIESMVIEYYEISKRILDELNYLKSRDLYDEYSIIKAQENIDKLFLARIEIKDKIIKAAMQFEKLILEKEKQEILKQKARAATEGDIEEFLEPVEL